MKPWPPWQSCVACTCVLVTSVLLHLGSQRRCGVVRRCGVATKSSWRCPNANCGHRTMLAILMGSFLVEDVFFLLAGGPRLDKRDRASAAGWQDRHVVREANKAQKKRNYFKIVPNFGEKSDTQEKSLLAFFLDFDLILIVLQRRFGTRKPKNAYTSTEKPLAARSKPRGKTLVAVFLRFFTEVGGNASKIHASAALANSTLATGPTQAHHTVR